MWWEKYNGVPEFKGLKISQDVKVQHRPKWNIRRVTVERNQDRILVGKFGTLGWGGNSGFHAINLAVQFGVKFIALVGFDMRTDKGLHWHGKHVAGLNNPTPPNVDRWRRVTDEAAPALEALGVTVVNCSPASALKSYPKMSLSEALLKWQNSSNSAGDSKSAKHVTLQTATPSSPAISPASPIG